MTPHVLDNPIWESLISRHRPLAQRLGGVARYPAAVAPFLGVAALGIDAGAALEALVAPDGRAVQNSTPQNSTVRDSAAQNSVFLLGPTPSVPDGWRVEKLAMLAQMVCPARMAEVDGPAITELTDTHRADVLALTALVYPHYFRPRTTELGRYFGIYRDGRLAAMIGERMGMDAWQEISAVCTHPDFNGRGYARHLLAWLSNDNLARGRIPFLHVSHDNQRAKRLYEQGGYRDRGDIGFWSLRRVG